MSAEDFNAMLAERANEQLIPLGFKKSGVHYYIHRVPNIMVFHKKTYRGLFEGFYLALTHDFMSDTVNEKKQLKVPPYLENFPFSISLSELKNQYAKHSSAAKFSCDTNFMTREVLITRQHSKTHGISSFLTGNFQDRPDYSQAYLDQSIEILLADGMRLFNEYSPAISYLSVTRWKVNDPTLERFKTELGQYSAANQAPLPKQNSGWLRRIFGK